MSNFFVQILRDQIMHNNDVDGMERIFPIPQNFNETDIQYEIRLLQILYDDIHKNYIYIKKSDIACLYGK